MEVVGHHAITISEYGRIREREASWFGSGREWERVTLSGDRVGATGAAESVMLGRRRDFGPRMEGAAVVVGVEPEA